MEIGNLFCILRFHVSFLLWRFESKKAVGSLHIIPLECLLCRRKLVFYVQSICIIPPGVDIIQALGFLVDDIILGAAECFEWIDEKGEEVEGFLRTCRFLGDYHALRQIIDVMKHINGAPCTYYWSLRVWKCNEDPKHEHSIGFHGCRRFCAPSSIEI